MYATKRRNNSRDNIEDEGEGEKRENNKNNS
jgi:hypothetical protein